MSIDTANGLKRRLPKEPAELAAGLRKRRCPPV